MTGHDDYREDVVRYYNKRESRLGYRVFLRGRKHFGYYPAGRESISMTFAQKLMEDRVGIALSLPHGALVLDAGCGEGHTAMRLAQRFGLQVEGIDLLDFNIARGRQLVQRHRSAARVRLQVGDYTALPFADETFDGIYTIEALVHAPEPQSALKEFLRVLKPGGKLVLFEYSMPAQQDLNTAEREAFAAINKGSAMYSFPLFENGKFGEILTAAGFEFGSVTDIRYRIKPMLRRMALICWLPYKIAKLTSDENRYVNARAAVEYYRLRELMHYNIVIGYKP
ncbi:MAG: class I SAM-dependent methyltransferase [Actinomadura sp.]